MFLKIFKQVSWVVILRNQIMDSDRKTIWRKINLEEKENEEKTSSSSADFRRKIYISVSEERVRQGQKLKERRE